MIFQLDAHSTLFPHPSLADEDGLLAVGGDLRTERLLSAYRQGIFPWYSEDTPILWYAPRERFVLYPSHLKVSKSLRQFLRNKLYSVTFNQAFDKVIHACASINRKDQDGTWIVDEMQQAYIQLHREGYAHSIEVWDAGELVGGLYGVLVGQVFCGESMFSRVSNASKIALSFLCQNFDLKLIDCQIHSDHLESMGAQLISSSEFYSILDTQEFEAHGLQKLFRHS